MTPDLSQALAFAHLGGAFPGGAPGASAALAASAASTNLLRAGVKRPATTSLPSPIPSANHFVPSLGQGQRTSSPKVKLTKNCHFYEKMVRKSFHW